MVRRTFVLTLALALLAPATASAQWQPPTSLTGDVPSVSDPDVLFAARGDKIVGYGVNGRSAYSRTLPGQDAPFHQRVTTTSDGSARLLTYASEHVMLVSQTAGALVSDLRAQFGTVGGGVGSVKRIAPGHDAARYDAAINSNGEAAVAYIRLVRGERGIIRKRQIAVVRRPKGGSFGKPEIIVGNGGPQSVAAAIAPHGEIVVAYEASGRVYVRRREPGHSWSSPQPITYAAKGHTQLALAAGGDGSFVLGTFSQELTEGGDNGPASVRVATRSSGGHAFHSARLFETYSERAPQGAGVRVALASDGTGVVGWTGRQAGHFVAHVADVGGDVGLTVSSPASDAVLGGVAAGPGGAAAAIWAPPLDTPSPQVFAAVRENAGIFGPPEAVGAPQREVATPAIGIDPKTRRPLAAWVARTGQHTQAVLAALRA